MENGNRDISGKRDGKKGAMKSQAEVCKIFANPENVKIKRAVELREEKISVL